MLLTTNTLAYSVAEILLVRAGQAVGRRPLKQGTGAGVWSGVATRLE